MFWISCNLRMSQDIYLRIYLRIYFLNVKYFIPSYWTPLSLLTNNDSVLKILKDIFKKRQNYHNSCPLSKKTPKLTCLKYIYVSMCVLKELWNRLTYNSICEMYRYHEKQQKKYWHRKKDYFVSTNRISQSQSSLLINISDSS